MELITVNDAHKMLNDGLPVKPISFSNEDFIESEYIEVIEDNSKLYIRLWVIED